MKFQNEKSKSMAIPSSILFNCLVNKVIEETVDKTRGVFIQCYADDIAIVVKKGFMKVGMEQAARTMQRVLEFLQELCTKLSMSINTKKTEIVCFGRRMKKLPAIFLDGTPLKYVMTYKYLGVTMDPKLSFIPLMA